MPTVPTVDVEEERACSPEPAAAVPLGMTREDGSSQGREGKDCVVGGLVRLQCEVAVRVASCWVSLVS
jgi:hypothetical protein